VYILHIDHASLTHTHIYTHPRSLALLECDCSSCVALLSISNSVDYCVGEMLKMENKGFTINRYRTHCRSVKSMIELHSAKDEMIGGQEYCEQRMYSKVYKV